MNTIITLATDFGSGSPYVAAMKGVILGINPATRLIDIAHNIGPQNIRQAAAVLAEATSWFPPNGIHVAVVDPGVGTSRRLIYARIGDQHYLAPDNGLLSLLAARGRVGKIVELNNPEYWLPEVSHTFHGRDILSPVAAQLSLGLEPERLGTAVREIEQLDWPQPKRHENRIDGAVQWIDSFGNLISNIPDNLLDGGTRANFAAWLENSARQFKIECAGRAVSGIVRSYGHRPPGELVALVGSSGFLEIAIVNGSAASVLQAPVGTQVVVEWKP